MSNYAYEMWEAVIGLEVHVQLNTKSKLFSHAPNRFGDEPNTNITDVCTGLPGTLPVINKEALKKAMLFGLAIKGEVSKYSTFDRKSYFYPDSPRNFQITQLDNPIVIGGTIIADVDGQTKEFAVNRAHLEDDAGMLKHFSSFAGVDYNRAGVPLLEVVSEPVLRSPKEAIAYVMALRAIMQYINASDCNMEEGHLRVDANISVRPKGEKTLRNKTEIKNMNSYTYLEVAMEAEIKRQIKLYTDHPHKKTEEIIIPGTYRWDLSKKQTTLMRKKESQDDYRYFHEPDLPPIVLTDIDIENVKKQLPELPHDRYNRYISQFKLSEYNASILINDKKLSNYFEEALAICKNARSICNWITVEFTGRLKDRTKSIYNFGICAKNIAKLVNMIDKGTITGKIAKSVADDMIENPNLNPEDIVKNNPDYQPLSDTGEIEPIVDQVLKDNPQSIQDYRDGKKKAFGFLVGQVMKLTKGKSSPQIVNELLHKKLDANK
jgi:aspartyl-tRNA(Asn)/glutamyl-tRNA(Gln) amidotransferase subunit B